MTWHISRSGSHRVVNLQVMSVQGVTDMRGSSSDLHQQGEVRSPVDLPPSSPLTPLRNGVSGPAPTTGSVDPTAALPQGDARPDHQQAVATMETTQVRDDSVGQDGRVVKFKFFQVVRRSSRSMLSLQANQPHNRVEWVFAYSRVEVTIFIKARLESMRLLRFKMSPDHQGFKTTSTMRHHAHKCPTEV